MSEASILYNGMFCFSLILLAFVLTAREFRKMAHSQPQTAEGPVHRTKAKISTA
jgi:hypothetical protein